MGDFAGHWSIYIKRPTPVFYSVFMYLVIASVCICRLLYRFECVQEHESKHVHVCISVCMCVCVYVCVCLQMCILTRSLDTAVVIIPKGPFTQAPVMTNNTA